MTLAPTLAPLRSAVLFDACGCLLSALLLTLASEPLARLTGFDATLLNAAGLLLFPVSAWMAWVAFRAVHSASAVQSIVVGNLAWVVASAVVWWLQTPTGIGTALLVGQALAVLAIAAVEHALARRASAGEGGRSARVIS